ncbi:MAG TPA: formate dehydrogenase accessory sulfurtransferase FdhD [Anaerolineaceae bacterium]|nr:formate dehydrogenase accessory sulfurtransferase FdhD [Anaerolineaceae bacterium]
MPAAHASIRINKYRSGRWEGIDARIIVECPVILSVNGQAWLTFLCTPTDLAELAAGFLFNEDLLHAREELAVLEVCSSGERVDVWLKHKVEKPLEWRQTSGCSGGVTAVVEDNPAQPAAQRTSLAAEQVGALMEDFLAAQSLYRLTRGVHSSALSDGQRIVAQAEDIGRHNTLDKLAGKRLLEPDLPPASILLTTGRISSDMLQKSLRLGVSMVISRTGVNTLSVKMAETNGITLIGYARREEFTVFTHLESIRGSG